MNRRISVNKMSAVLSGYGIGFEKVEENSTKNYQVFEDSKKSKYLFSYDTLILFVSYGGVKLKTWYFGYSRTTSTHQTKFMGRKILEHEKIGYMEYAKVEDFIEFFYVVDRID